jgi:uncharacterized repeat protein (TIGR03803 family)
VSIPAGPTSTIFSRPPAVSGDQGSIVKAFQQAVQLNAPANEIRPATVVQGCDALPALNFLNGSPCDVAPDGARIVFGNPATGVLLTANLPRNLSGTGGTISALGRQSVSSVAPAMPRFLLLGGSGSVMVEEDGMSGSPTAFLHLGFGSTGVAGDDSQILIEEDAMEGEPTVGSHVFTDTVTALPGGFIGTWSFAAHADLTVASTSIITGTAHVGDAVTVTALAGAAITIVVLGCLLGGAGHEMIEEDSMSGEVTIPSGTHPMARPLLAGSTLYGTCSEGGAHGLGAAWKIATDGSGFTVLRHFAGYTADGDTPLSGFVLDSSDRLCATTRRGGSRLDAVETLGGAPGRCGIVYRMAEDGSGFTKLENFGYVLILEGDPATFSGLFPLADLLFDGTYLYGTASWGEGTVITAIHGGPAHPAGGVVFKVKPDGTSFSVLHNFGADRSHGEFPQCALVSDGTYLYGTLSPYPDIGTPGCIFKVKPDGTSYAVVRDFASDGSEGWSSWSTLVLDGVHLYGTARAGSGNKGIVFTVKTDGTAFTILYTFGGGASDGDESNDITADWWNGSTPLAFPAKALVFATVSSQPTLFGVTTKGGASDKGIVYSCWNDGTHFTILHSFDGADGEGPEAALILSGSTLYGTTRTGGERNLGTVFSVGVDGSGFALLHSFEG